jgi:predicted pyridoxine 5'-phosphate oxidase superfamily flavin-nucleotide-binding protein
LTPAVREAEARQYGRSFAPPRASGPDALGEAEVEFIGRRDSFYMATVSADGWPYIQHRGGPPGFLTVLDAHTLAFADFKGNRQLISTGNLAGNDRVSLFLMDYVQRARLKILGHARVADARTHPELVQRLAPRELGKRVERIVTIDVVGHDWNCPAYITPRFTEAEIREAIATGWKP